MKKSLIALAVLAASGASFAQSSVTLYGIADFVIHKDKNASVKLSSGGLDGSRFGFKGTEDLGGGLKANFQLEQGFNLDTGTAETAVKAFSKKSWVGLSGGFGEIKVGQIGTAYDDMNGAGNSVMDAAFSPNAIFVSSNYGGNPGNNIYYTTPSMGGFGAAISASLKEGVNPTENSFHVRYEGGPVFVALGYQINKGNPVIEGKFTKLAGSYDLGVAKLKAVYGQANPTGANNDIKDLGLGVDIPVSPSLTAYVGVASSKKDGQDRASSFALGASYMLSKRTTIYGGYRNDNDSAVLNRAATDTRFGVGVRHTF